MLQTIKLAAELLIKRIPYILITTLCIYGIAYVFQLGFYRYAPPAVFLRMISAKIDTAQITQPLQLTFCRYARATYLDAKANRSFFKLEGDKRISAGEYSFEADYERGEDCQLIQIPVNRHPQESGVYYAETSIRFKVQFDDYVFWKEYTYQTETFRLSDTVQGLQQQIKTLQDEINILKAILRSRGVDVPDDMQTSQLLPSTLSSPATNGGASSGRATSTPRQDSVADNSAPAVTQPQTPDEPFVTMIVDGTIKTVRGTTDELLNRVDRLTTSVL